MCKRLYLGIVFSVLATSVVQAGLKFQFDYRYDSVGFFDPVDRREMLEAAAGVVNRYVDNLAAIEPSGDNDYASFLSKPDGSGDLIFGGEPIPQDTLLIFVAGRPLGDRRLAHAIELGALGSGSPEFIELVDTRNQLGAKNNPATDNGPTGGTITFNSNPDQVDWHFGLSTRRLEFSEHDFITVAAHEIIHLLGIGTAKSWRDNINFSGEFIGSEVAAILEEGQLRPKGDDSHWLIGTNSTWNGKVQEALLAPEIASGRRLFPTILDRAALRDIGWEEAADGDANLDRVFDSSDLVSMFSAGKFEVNTLAFWTEGDFNDDGLFNSSDLVDALATGSYSNAASTASSIAVEGAIPEIVLIYNRVTGALSLDSNEQILTTFQVSSGSAAFKDSQWDAAGLFDISRSDKVFKMDVNGFSDVSFGRILPENLELEFLSGDLTVDGSRIEGGRLGLLKVVSVPEPHHTSTALLFALGVLSMTFCRRRVV